MLVVLTGGVVTDSLVKSQLTTGSQVATVVRVSDGVVGWTALIGTTIVASKTSTTYRIEL